MIDEEFEWDDEKERANAKKHGVSFNDAKTVFRDPFAIEFLDDRENYGEDRFILIGVSAARILVVVYVVRGERNRILSARPAAPNERRFYHEQNQRF